MGTINHYAKPDKDENNYKKRFQFGFSKDVYCHCIIHADTQEAADQVAKKIFKNGEDNKDWYFELGTQYIPECEGNLLHSD